MRVERQAEVASQPLRDQAESGVNQWAGNSVDERTWPLTKKRRASEGVFWLPGERHCKK
jgi:hypothetical protein